MSAPRLRVLDSPAELAREAAVEVVELLGAALRERGRARLVLAGGSTPRALYRELAAEPLRSRLDWTRVECFFGDERCVPPDHADSNFRMANEILLAPLKIAPDRVFRMRGEDDPEQAARRYEESIQKEFGTSAAPRFDLILLGLGDDGHTASLFPGTPALDERRRLVVPNRAPQGATQRITFTASLINQARAVVFLVSGRSKAPALKAVLEDRAADPARFPAKLVRPEEGRLIWFLDRAAAADLTIEQQRINSHEE